MVKTILKEISILILLCVAIVLILGVLLYDYIPSNKVVPNKIAYSTPENIQSELNEKITEVNKTEVSYEITGSDLSLYKQSHSYTSGKPDPFAAPTTDNGNTSSNTNTSGNTTGNGNGQNSTNTFFNNTGLK